MESKKSLNIFENTNYSFDRRESQSLVIDVDRTSAGDSVEFKVKLVEPLIIDKQSNVYLDSLTTFKCLQSKEISKMGFLLSIDDFPIKTASNGPLIHIIGFLRENNFNNKPQIQVIDCYLLN